MMKRFDVFFGACVICAMSFGQTKPDTWGMFARTKFEPKYYEKIGEYLFYPNFPADLKALEGKEITIEGYYVPFSLRRRSVHHHIQIPDESMFLLRRRRS